MGQTVETARRTLTARLKSAAIDSAELDARLLVGAALGLDLTGMITGAHRRLGGLRRAGRGYEAQQGDVRRAHGSDYLPGPA